MVLIFSNNNDFSTQKIIDWLNYINCNWFRINEDDDVVLERLVINGEKKEPQIVLRINGIRLDLTKVKSYWFRRGRINISIGSNFCSNRETNIHIYRYLVEEVEHLTSFIFQYLAEYKHSLGDFHSTKNKKFTYLLLARKAGLTIPNSYMTSQQCFLKDISRREDLITKSSYESISFPIVGDTVFSYTNTVDASDIRDSEEAVFFPTLFQQQIDKVLEIRVFFFIGVR